MKRTAFVLMFVTMACAVAEAQTTIYFKRDTLYSGPGGAAIAIITPASSDTTPPTAPSSLGVTATTATSVALSWTGSTDGGSGVAGYKVFRQRGSSGPSLPVGTVNSSTTAFTDQPLEPSQSYYYVIVAFDHAQNHSSVSNSVNPTTSSASTDTTPPSAPLQLTAQVLGSTTVKLNFLAATDAGGSGVAAYRIKRGGSDVSGWFSATAFAYTDDAAPQNSSLTYTAEAKDGQGNISSASNSVNVTTPLDSTPPSTPSSPSASGLTSTSIRVGWTASSDLGGSLLSGYRVYRAGTLISGSNPVTGTSFDETGLAANTTYTNYTIKAIDGAGNLSAAAGPVSATTLPDTTPPTTPGTITVDFGDDWVSWSFGASTDSGGSELARYEVYFVTYSGGNYEEFLMGQTWDLPPDTFTWAYTTDWTWDEFWGFRVYAVDGAGNRSSPRSWTP